MPKTLYFAVLLPSKLARQGKSFEAAGVNDPLASNAAIQASVKQSEFPASGLKFAGRASHA
jgi:hypothetical protein